MDIRKDPEQGVFARAGIDVNRVTGHPREKLRFGLHAVSRAAGAARGKPFSLSARWASAFLLGAAAAARLRGWVLLAVVTKTSSFGVSFEGYPDWLVILLGALVAALAIWIFIKLIKLALWLLLFVVLIGGVVAAWWLLFHGS